MQNHETLSVEGRLLFWSWTIILSLASFIATALVIGEFFSGNLAQGFDFLGYFIGAGLDLAKLSLTAIVLVAVWRKQFSKALSFSIIAIPLMTASIALSITFMSDTTDAQWTEKSKVAQSSTQSAQQIGLIDSQIQDQRASMEGLRKQFDSNTDANYRQMNIELSETIKGSEQRLNALVLKRSSLVESSDITALTEGEITLYGMDKSIIEMIIMLTAILVDITAVTGSAYLMNDRIQRREIGAKKASEDRKDKIRSSLAPRSMASAAPAAQISNSVENEQKVEEPIEIKSGDDEIIDIAIDLIFNQGVKPSRDEIWSKGKDRGMSAKKARKAVMILFERGILEKNISGHFVVSENAHQLLS